MTLAAKRLADAQAFKVRKVEILDGWVYIDGVRTRKAQPEAVSQRTQNSMRRGGATRTGRGKP